VLFCGPSGTGKTTLARIYARGVLCTGASDSRPCNVCENCRSFLRAGAHEAYHEFSCPSRRGVGANQDLAERIERGAIWQDRRIVFLDEVHALSKQSFETLLKPMEHGERPAAVICATTESDKVPRTIADRLHCVPFDPIASHTIEEALIRVCQQETLAFDDDAIAAIAADAGGSYRKALKDLDQVTVNTRNITLALVSDTLKVGMDGRHAMEAAMEMLNGNGQAVLDTLQHWRLTPDKKADALQRVLLFVYLTKVRRRRHADTLVRTVPSDALSAIESKMSYIAEVKKLQLEVAWQNAIQFWDPERATTEASLIARADRFADLMCVQHVHA
jgi:DNA polymerase III subunit gamma/tau